MKPTVRVCPCCLRALDPEQEVCPVHDQVPDPRIGSLIDDSYRLARLLEADAEVRVYQGEDVRLGRRLTVKVIAPDTGGHTERLRRFRLEARAIASMDHHHVVTIHDIRDMEDGSVALITEHLRGEPLAQRLETGGPLPLNAVGRIVTQTALALGAAHAKNLVHRDVTPDSIFLLRRAGRDDFVKLAGFGLVKRKMRGLGVGLDRAMTAQGEVVGTPEYMSPEQVRAAPVDHRADIYALGMVAYTMVCGQPAFPGRDPAAMMRHLTDAPLGPSATRPELPPAAEAAILRALSKEPEARFAAVEAFAAELSAALQDTTGVRMAMADPEATERASTEISPEAHRHQHQQLMGMAATAAQPVPATLGGVSLGPPTPKPADDPSLPDTTSDIDRTTTMERPSFLSGTSLDPPEE